jgi:hypothetical protein
MANTFTADLRRFADLTNQNMKYVATEAIQDVVEGMLTPQRGVSKGGSGFVEGKIPRCRKRPDQQPRERRKRIIRPGKPDKLRRGDRGDGPRRCAAVRLHGGSCVADGVGIHRD